MVRRTSCQALNCAARGGPPLWPSSTSISSILLESSQQDGPDLYGEVMERQDAEGEGGNAPLENELEGPRIRWRRFESGGVGSGLWGLGVALRTGEMDLELHSSMSTVNIGEKGCLLDRVKHFLLLHHGHIFRIVNERSTIYGIHK